MIAFFQLLKMLTVSRIAGMQLSLSANSEIQSSTLVDAVHACMQANDSTPTTLAFHDKAGAL